MAEFSGRRFWRRLWQWPLALLILFEEWGWEPLQRLLGRLARWPGLRQLEHWIGRQSPRLSLALLATPSLLLLPVKLMALWLIGRGHYWLGFGVIVAAKLVGTAIVARLFSLTQPALMQLPWFARLYTRWVGWKDALTAWVRTTLPWRLGRVWKRAWQAMWRRSRPGWMR